MKIAIRQQDCNKYLRETFLRRKWEKLRAIVFLDPFGMQVPWNTIELLAETRAVEVFVNFPVGMPSSGFCGGMVDLLRAKERNSINTLVLQNGLQSYTGRSWPVRQTVDEGFRFERGIDQMVPS